MRSSTSYSRVTLAPGRMAHFNLTYLPSAVGDSTDIAVTTMVITPPNDYSHTEVVWHQSVLLQDAATHPGTFIGPVMSGA